MRHRYFCMTVGLALAVSAGVPVRAHEPRDRLSGTARSGGNAQQKGTSLGRINRIVGDQTAMMTVRIPRRARVETTKHMFREHGPNPYIKIRGSGRFAGIVLMRLPADPSTITDELVAGRWRGCGTPGCDTKTDEFNYVFPSGNDRRRSYTNLAAGIYRLYLIADDTPVEVTLRLDGLSGTRTVTPQEPAPVDLDTPEPQYSLDQGRSIWAAGNTYDAGAPGLVLLMMYVLSSDFEGADVGGCVYAFPTAPPEKAAYGPHCNHLVGAGLGGGFQWDHYPEGGPSKGGIAMVANFEYGSSPFFPNVGDRYGAGVWYSSPRPIERVGSQALFVTYDEQ